MNILLPPLHGNSSLPHPPLLAALPPGCVCCSVSAADDQNSNVTRLTICSQHFNSNFNLATKLPPSRIFQLLFFLLLLLLDLAGLLHRELAQALRQRHPSGSGRISDGECHHVVVHHLRQLHAAKLPVQLTGQL